MKSAGAAVVWRGREAPVPPSSSPLGSEPSEALGKLAPSTQQAALLGLF